MKISKSAFLALLLALPMVCGAQSDEDIDASTETTYDGLVQVRRLAQTWTRLMTRGLNRWVESGGVVE